MQNELWEAAVDAGTAVPRLTEWPVGVEAVAPDWQPLLQRFLASAEGQRVTQHLRAALAAGDTVFPPQPLRALQLTPSEAVRVVIIGQDPYHGPGQANGLAFDVAPGVKAPPSLRNIGKELAREFGRAPEPGQRESLLEDWARQGVLLLNTSLTVAAGQAGSHARIGWQALTGALFRQLAEDTTRPRVFMLWGAHAQALRPAGSGAPHLWLEANHPSPLSALRPPVPFIGCGHFGRANAFLQALGERPIDWIGVK